MNWQAITFDWNQVRAFLATAEEGSLSAAARALGQTQPTLSRQVAGLEDTLGVVLFERGPRTMVLTEAGREVLAHVRAMGEAATRVSLAASGQSQQVEGVVSVTATNLFATHYLPPILAHLREAAPGIMVNVITSNDVRDLTRREADISIRHARPEQPDLIGRLVSETTARLYASRGFIERHGAPETLEELAEVPFVGFEVADRLVPILQSLGLDIRESNIAATTASGSLLIALVRQGIGVSILTQDTAERCPDLVEVFPSLTPIPVPVWLVAHRELHTSRRIRVVFDALADALSTL